MRSISLATVLTAIVAVASLACSSAAPAPESANDSDTSAVNGGGAAPPADGTAAGGNAPGGSVAGGRAANGDPGIAPAPTPVNPPTEPPRDPKPSPTPVPPLPPICDLVQVCAAGTSWNQERCACEPIKPVCDPNKICPSGTSWSTTACACVPNTLCCSDGAAPVDGKCVNRCPIGALCPVFEPIPCEHLCCPGGLVFSTEARACIVKCAPGEACPALAESPIACPVTPPPVVEGGSTGTNAGASTAPGH
jgi:hypothetical protein